MAVSEPRKKFKVTVFLIKDGYAKIEDFLSFRDFRVVQVQSGGKEIGTLVYKGGFQSRPAWVSIFDAARETASTQIGLA
jgi:2-C-methyl-D-erythritol 4-phosphate cytidylyltransferase